MSDACCLLRSHSLSGQAEAGSVPRSVSSVRAPTLLCAMVRRPHLGRYGMGKNVTGWRAISRYTGASIDELRHAVWFGELQCGFRNPKLKKRRLDAWLFTRQKQQRLDRMCDLVLGSAKMSESHPGLIGGPRLTA